MKKIDFNFFAKNLDNIPVKGWHVGGWIASALAQSTTGNPLKVMAIARKLHAKEPVLLDSNDCIFLGSFIEKSETIPNIIKDQAIEVILKAK